MSSSDVFSDRASELCKGVVLDNWEHSVKQVSSLSKDLYSVLLDIEDARDGGADDERAARRSRRRAEVRRMLLQAGSRQASQFAPLECLLPRVGAVDLMRDDAGLVVRLMEALTAPGAGGRGGPGWLRPGRACVMGMYRAGLLESTSMAMLTTFLVAVRSEMDAAAGLGVDDARNFTPLSACSWRAQKLARQGSRAPVAEAERRAAAVAARERVAREWRALWVPPLAAALRSLARAVRMAHAHQTLPKLLAIDPESAGAIAAEIGSTAPPPDGLVVPHGEMCAWERQLWAHLTAVNAARALSIVDGRCITLAEGPDGLSPELVLPDVPHVMWDARAASGDALAPPAPVSPGEVTVRHSELMRALVHPDSDIRNAALDTVCVTKQKRDVPSSLECRLLVFALPTLAKTADPKQRADLVRALAYFMDRLHDSAAHARKRALFVAAQPGSRVEDTVEYAQLRAIAAVLREIQRTLLAGIYPGATYERIQTSLDALYVLVRVFPPRALRAPVTLGASAAVDPLDVPLGVFGEPATAVGLCNALVIGWDRARPAIGKVSAISQQRARVCTCGN